MLYTRSHLFSPQTTYPMQRRLKTPAIARKRRRLLYTKIAGIFALFAFLLVGLSFLSSFSSLQIQAVEVLGTKPGIEKQIKLFTDNLLKGRTFFIFSKSNKYLYPREEIRSTILEKHILINNAKISVNNENTLIIKTTKRKRAYLWCEKSLQEKKGSPSTSEECYFLDKNGILFEIADGRSPFFIELYGNSKNLQKARKTNTKGESASSIGKSFLNQESLKKIFLLIGRIQKIGLETKWVEADPQNGISINTVPGVEIRFFLTQAVQDIESSLQTFLNDPEFKENEKMKRFQSLDYLDLRFPDRVYYKYNP